MPEKIGIKDLKELLVFFVTLVVAVKEARADGKWGLD